MKTKKIIALIISIIILIGLGILIWHLNKNSSRNLNRGSNIYADNSGETQEKNLQDYLVIKALEY